MSDNSIMEVSADDERVTHKANHPKLSLLSDTPYKHFLKHEVEFLMNGDMSILINPNMLYIQNERDIWNDSIAYFIWK